MSRQRVASATPIEDDTTEDHTRLPRQLPSACGMVNTILKPNDDCKARIVMADFPNYADPLFRLILIRFLRSKSVGQLGVVRHSTGHDNGPCHF
jgi:hypothetical protein